MDSSVENITTVLPEALCKIVVQSSVPPQSTIHCTGGAVQIFTKHSVFFLTGKVILMLWANNWCFCCCKYSTVLVYDRKD